MTVEIRTGDFRTLSDELGAGSVDLTLTDPPYERAALPLWGDLGRVAARVLKPGGFLVTYSGQMYLNQILRMLDEHLVYWWKSEVEHQGRQISVPARGVYANASKPILVYAKPPVRKPCKWFKDLYVSSEPNKTFHKWGQSLSVTRQLVEEYSEPGDLVLDPMVGGGTTCVAALQTGRSCIGFEVNPVTADVARARVATAQLPLFVPGAVGVQAALW